jgi:hypothetical protein
LEDQELDLVGDQAACSEVVGVRHEDMGADQYCSLCFGGRNVSWAVGCFKSVYENVHAGGFSFDRGSDEPQHGAGYDGTDAGCDFVDHSCAVALFGH